MGTYIKMDGAKLLRTLKDNQKKAMQERNMRMEDMVKKMGKKMTHSDKPSMMGMKKVPMFTPKMGFGIA